MYMIAMYLILWASYAFGSGGLCQPLGTLSFAHQPATIPGLSAHVIYNNISAPRGMRIDEKQNLLVVERYIGVTALTFRNDSTCVGWEKRPVVRNETLEHGIEIGPGEGKFQYLYASSMEFVFRWEYDPDTISVIGDPIVVAYNMSNVGAIPPDHVTRTLLLEPPIRGKSRYLIVSRGSAGNIDDAAADPNHGTAQIRRFCLDQIPPRGYEWKQGQLLSWGNRNAVGIALSRDGKSIWDIENSSDNVFWRGIDVHQDNPADELYVIPIEGNEKIPLERKFYGYPHCFTAWNRSTVPRNTNGPQFNFKLGEQFSIRNPPAKPTDEWCANPKNNVPPRLSLEAHVSPLDLVFYYGAKGPSKVGLSQAWINDAFTSFHGSWNRDIPIGYSVIRIPFTEDGREPVAKRDSDKGYEKLVWMADTSRCPTECIRPVGTVFTKAGELIVSSDDSNEIFIIQRSNVQ